MEKRAWGLFWSMAYWFTAVDKLASLKAYSESDACAILIYAAPCEVQWQKSKSPSHMIEKS